MSNLKRSIIAMARVYFFWLLLFILQKPLFMLWYRGAFSGVSVIDYLQVIWHGLPLDFSLAGYLTVIPCIFLIVRFWARSWFIHISENIYYGIAAALVSVTFLLNMVLYEYWNFPLDATPLFYFVSSPKDAFASATPELIIGGLLSLALLVFLIYVGVLWCYSIARLRSKSNRPQRIVSTICMVLLTSLLFIPIRGGFSTATMNTGRVYYSDNQSLNHAAVNPLFSIMESLTHQKDFGSQYRFMESGKASKLFKEMVNTSSENTEILLSNQRPNIYIIILESFSSHIMKTLGGKDGIAVNLDKLGQEGILFTNFYANSFRTDRGIVSILSGFPAQPNMSLMKYPHKTTSLPSIAKSLKSVNYKVKYYYGGDVNFTNMRSYLFNQGFEDIVSDVDFPIKERLSKWGVPDHFVFERLVNDIKANQQTGSKQPQLCVLQTSSSHEPYDVPYHKLDNERLNAFSYTDDCIGKFMTQLRELPSWDNTLVVFIPDHQGCWPIDMDPQKPSRYQIPLIMVGGAVKEHRQIDTFGSQQDFAATLLGQLGVDHSDFTYSKDLLNPDVNHFAFLTFPDLFGLITNDKQIIFDNKQERIVYRKGDNADELLPKGQAYLQTIYDDIDRR